MHLSFSPLLRRALLFMTVFALFGVPAIAVAVEPDCDISLRELVRAQEFRLAYICSEEELVRDPTNINAMLVLARAALELGQTSRADALAKAARTYDLTTGQRFAAYLISGMAQASQQNLTTAKILLYRASDFARAEPELDVVRRTLNQINGSSPWKFSAGINVLPSTNINGGSLHETITFGGLEFVLDDDAKAQSGVAYTASASVTHQRRVSAQAIWENRVSIAGTAYTGRGRNEGSYSVTSGLRYTPETVRPALIYGFLRYDQRFISDDIGGGIFGDYGTYYSQSTAGLEVLWNTGQSSAWKAYATFTNRNSDTSINQNVWIATVGASGRFTVNPRVELVLGGYVQQTEGASNLAAQAWNISLGAALDPDMVPFSFSGNLAYTHTQYTTIAAGYFEAREDDDVTLELSVAYNNLQFFGFRPSFGVAVSRNYSNLNRYDTQNTQMFTRISAAF